jgi:tetratricopeptide (TPR) repeat protein/transcriptional regulator with XRE-family HTH domain
MPRGRVDMPAAAESDVGLAELLRLRRLAANLTQDELARRSNLSVRTIRNLENGRTLQPRRQSVHLLARALALNDDEHDRLLLAAGGQPPLPEPERPSDATADQSKDHLRAHAVPRPAMLPGAAAHFVGRTDELAALDQAEVSSGASSAISVVAIVGPGGIGKTALAVQWGHRSSARFPDGQLFVDLRGFHPERPLRSEQALTRLLVALGVDAEEIPPDEDDAIARYRSLLDGRRMLLVLDNAQSVAQIRPLLPGSHDCFTIVTSRERLTGLIVEASAQRLGLDGLDLEVGVSLVRRIVGRERADAECRAVAELVSACAGLPLALCIASANLADRADLTIAQYVRRLMVDDRLVALCAGEEGPALKSTFELSYRSLASLPQRVFRCLGLVPGPDFTPDAVAAMGGISVGTATANLERLVGAHFVQRHGTGRYALHDLIRLYAQQVANAADPARGRLFAYYVRRCRAAAEELYPQMLRLPADMLAAKYVAPAERIFPGGAKDWLAAELHNIVAACVSAADQGPPEAACLLADALRGYFWQRRSLTDWQITAHAAERAADRTADMHFRTAVHLNLGHLTHLLGDKRESEHHYTAGIDLARRVSWPAAESTAAGNLATSRASMGDYRSAADVFRAALELHRAAGFRFGEATMLGNLGHTEAVLGHFDDAFDLLDQALVAYRELGSSAGQAVVLANLSGAEINYGRWRDAGRHAHEALELARQVGRLDTETLALIAISTLHRRRGEVAAANRTAEQAVGIVAKINDNALASEALATLGLARSDAGDHREAAEHLHRALDLARQMGHVHLEAEALVGLASVHHRERDRSSARSRLAEAMQIAREGGFQVILNRANVLAGELSCPPRQDRSAASDDPGL